MNNSDMIASLVSDIAARDREIKFLKSAKSSERKVVREITSEELSEYFGDDDWEQLVEYILNLLNRKNNVDDCYDEVVSYLEE